MTTRAEKRKKAQRKRRLLIAAAAVLLIVLGTAGWLYLSTRDQELIPRQAESDQSADTKLQDTERRVWVDGEPYALGIDLRTSRKKITDQKWDGSILKISGLLSILKEFPITIDGIEDIVPVLPTPGPPDLVVCVVTLDSTLDSQDCYAKTEPDGRLSSHCYNDYKCDWQEVEYNRTLFGLIFYDIDREYTEFVRKVRQRSPVIVGRLFDPGLGQTADTPPALAEYNDFVDAVIFADNQETKDRIADLNAIMLDLVNERLCVPTRSGERKRRERPFPDYPLGACADKACKLRQSKLMLSW